MGRRVALKSLAERRQIVGESYLVSDTVSGVARIHGIAQRLLQDWRAKLDKLNDQGAMSLKSWRMKCRKKTLQPPRRQKDTHALFSILNDLHVLRSQSMSSWLNLSF